MVKILSRSGDSLADTYNVVGSVAGIEQLETRELPIVHEMGATLFSERFSTTIRRQVSGALNQSNNFDVVITNLPAGISRIFGVAVFVPVAEAGRVSLAQVSVRDPTSGRELPIWLWSSVAGSEVTARLEDNAGGVATVSILRPAQPLEAIPSILTGRGQPQRVSDIAIRAETLAFGAGTVTITALVYIGFSQVGGISSRGLPVPSW